MSPDAVAGPRADPCLRLPGCSSPEILLGSNAYSEATDIWSMGCILYELLTLKHPFQRSDFVQEPKILDGEFDPIPDHYSSEMKSLVNACLSVDPNDRPDADEILNIVQ